MSPRMFWTLFLLVPAMFWALVVSVVTDAHARSILDNVTSCQSVEKRNGVVVTSITRGERTTQRRNLSVSGFPTIGKRTMVRKPVVTGQARVVKCSVQGTRVRLVTRGRAVVTITQKTPTVTTPSVPAGPTAPPPAVRATWQKPVSLQSSVTNDWAVTAAVAAWNTALPEGRKIALQPCDPNSGCIMLGEVASITEGPTWWGAAYISHNPGADIISCSISLSSITPDWGRASVTAHEIGHCMGLPHWDEFEGSVMSSLAYHDKGGPSSWDLAWLSSAYSVTP